ncbi:hypothetical protein [Pontibaca methylaminivorans]|uniref:hypothetical protein n=1 Tax=Pontibaca methylaminivorans TaxID=515897 RepID=UPI00117BE918|nr:hypothetical protein [Pontibaca methylaminivorans]
MVRRFQPIPDSRLQAGLAGGFPPGPLAGGRLRRGAAGIARAGLPGVVCAPSGETTIGAAGGGASGSVGLAIHAHALQHEAV